MRPLYTAQVSRPLSPISPRPTRLGFSTIAWCPHEDLLACVSGCGAVSVFHLDSPGEVALLVGKKRAPARHLLWRHIPSKPSMLVVADAAGRITMWVAKDRRVNVWTAAADLDPHCVAAALGWTPDGNSLVVVLAQGSVEVYNVPDWPVAMEANRKATDYAHGGARRERDRKGYETVKGEGSVVKLECKNAKAAEIFGGQVRSATVSGGGPDGSSVVLVTVAAAQPRLLKVWQVGVLMGGGGFEVKGVSSVEMDIAEEGKCVSVKCIPKCGMLYAVGDRGVICRWKNQRSGGDNGWMLQAKGNLERESESALEKSLVGGGTELGGGEFSMNCTTRALELCRKRKVYAMEVAPDGGTMVTSSSVGLLVWDTDKLKVVAGYSLADSKAQTGEGSPYWGVCISPGSAAMVALNGEGRVDAKSLVGRIAVGGGQVVMSTAKDVTKKLLSTTSPDGLTGGWDVIASVAMDGPSAANVVANAIGAMVKAAQTQNAVPTLAQLTNLKATMEGIANSGAFACSAAKKLLELATDAIRKSAPDNVKIRLMMQEKEAKQCISPDAVQKILTQHTNAGRVPIQQLAAAPLADWILVMCVVWLQRCAIVLMQSGGKGALGHWACLPSVMDSPTLSSKMPTSRGIAYDVDLIRSLRQACLPAAILLALEDEYGEPEADARYHRFRRAQSAQIVAAMWDVSIAWDVADAMAHIGPWTTREATVALSAKNGERIASTASALSRHAHVTQIVRESPELNVERCEKALGLHGSAVGAGFIMSCRRSYEGNASSDVGIATNRDRNTRGEWCPFDLVTGRPLPPWAPLRRCIVSGLLAAENTQQKSDSQVVMNAAAPWAARWSSESPLGGRWARVPSLDLERYELLPAVTPTVTDRSESGTQGSNVRHAKNEENVAANGTAPVAIAPPLRHPQMHPSAGVANQHNAVNAAAAAAAAAAAVAASRANQMNQHMMTTAAAVQNSGGVPGMPVGNAMHAAMQSRMISGSAGRVQASPGTASSTTDPGSTASKGNRKRSSSSASRSKGRKRPATERTASQFSDLAGSMGVTGLPSTSSPASGTPMVRGNTAADVLSTDTRSTVTAATNATGGQQDTSKPGRRSRKRNKAKESQRVDEAAAAAAAAAAALEGSNALVTGSTPPVVPQSLSQSAAMAQHNPQVSRAAMAKKHHPMSNQRNPSQVAAAAAAAAEAAAAAAHPNGKTVAVGRNTSMLPVGVHPDGMTAAGMNEPAEAVQQIPYVGSAGVQGTVGISAAALQAVAARRGNMTSMQNAAANLNMMGGANVAGAGGAAMPVNAGGMQQNNFAPRNPQESGFPGMSNVQTPEMAMMQTLGNAGGGPSGLMGPSGNALTSLALNFGVSAAQLANLPPAKLQIAIEALSRRAALNPGMNQPPGVTQDPPSGGSMPNLMGGNGLGAMPVVDMNAGAQAAGIGGLVGANGGAPGSQFGQQVGTPGRSTMGGASPAQVPMGTPRTSVAADSESPAQGRLGTVGLGGNEMRGRGIAQGAGDRGTGGVGAMTGGANSMNSTAGQGRAGAAGGIAESGERIWEGNLHVKGKKNDMLVLFVAIQCSAPEKLPLQETSGWPEQLECDVKELKHCSEVFPQMDEPTSQWYVKFVPITQALVEKERSRLEQFMRVLVERSLAFEINCNQPGGTPGTLFLWGVQVGEQQSLLGVFRPQPALQPDLTAEQDWQKLVNLGAGVQ